jgi:adenosylmethionine-8-amino-7-oxononanoate aminotransferase
MASPNSSSDHLWFPFTCHSDLAVFPPIVIERGEGMYLYDDSGKRYLDAIGSWWVNILGHNHPAITAAIKEQLDKLEHVMMAGFVTPPVLRLTSLLAEMLPPPLSRIFLSDDGSTAVEVALKIALQYWAIRGEKRTRFVALGNGYHGDTLGAMAVGSLPQYHELFHKRFKQEFFTAPPNCFRCPAGKQKESCSAECMDSLEEILKVHGETIAACIFEPMVQGAAGMRIYPARVLHKIFALCNRFGVLTIADEVAMGFGRTGELFACQHAGVVPDIMCLAKGLTGGYLPLAATVVTEKIYAQFCGDFLSERTFEHGHTFTGNPLAASAACATMEIIQSQNLPYAIHDTMAFFRTQLKQFEAFEIVGDIRSIGMVGAIELVQSRATKTRLPVERRIPFRICRKALDRGVLIRPLGDVIYFIPAYIITREQIVSMVSITVDAIREVMDEEAADL